MSDISHELRSRAQDYREPDSIGPLLAEAADEIDRLTSEVAALRPTGNSAVFDDYCETVNRVSEFTKLPNLSDRVAALLESRNLARLTALNAIGECKRLRDELDRLSNLFGSRFHLDSACGSCGGPLDVERDAICCRCTDADTQTVVDQLRKTEDGEYIVPGRTYWTLQFDEPIPWLCPVNAGYGDGRLYSTREAAQKARHA